MGRKYQSNSNDGYGYSFDFNIAQPMDTRTVVDSKEALTELDTWLDKSGKGYVFYQGMQVSVANTGELYVYKGTSSTTDVQKEENWIKASSSSGKTYTAGSGISIVNDIISVSGFSVTPTKVSGATTEEIGKIKVYDEEYTLYCNKASSGSGVTTVIASAYGKGNKPIGKIEIDGKTTEFSAYTYSSGTNISIDSNNVISVTGISASAATTSGTKIGAVKIGDKTTEFYAPSSKTYTQGTNISIDSNNVISVSGISASATTTSGESIGSITIGSTTTNFFAPTTTTTEYNFKYASSGGTEYNKDFSTAENNVSLREIENASTGKVDIYGDVNYFDCGTY